MEIWPVDRKHLETATLIIIIIEPLGKCIVDQSVFQRERVMVKSHGNIQYTWVDHMLLDN